MDAPWTATETTWPRPPEDRRFAETRRVLRKFSRQKPGMIGLVLILTLLLTAAFADQIAPYGYAEGKVSRESVLASPSAEHLAGTDRYGRDVFSRVIYGSRVSLAVALGATFISFAIGVPLGLFSGYIGGFIDDGLIMRVVDVVMAFPTLILLMVLAFVIGPSLSTVVFVVGFLYSPATTRITRGAVLASKNETYVEAARALGVPPWRIGLRHVLPNAIPTLLVLASLQMAGAILFEANLSFIGLGVQPPTPAWGTMLRDSYQLLERTPIAVLAPGAAIFLSVIGLSLLGDGIRDTADPTTR